MTTTLAPPDGDFFDRQVVLNLGCGREKLAGMVNVDLDQPGHDPDVVLDLNEAAYPEWVEKFGKDTVDAAQLIHVLEHIPNHLQMMENLWHVLKPGGQVFVRCPHGGSDDAWEDPTHVRPIFPGSFLYYAQPTYWRADYGYRGDFRVLECNLLCKPTPIQLLSGVKPDLEELQKHRNGVHEIVCLMEAVKPRRETRKELMEELNVQMVLVNDGWQ